MIRLGLRDLLFVLDVWVVFVCLLLFWVGFDVLHCLVLGFVCFDLSYL